MIPEIDLKNFDPTSQQHTNMILAGARQFMQSGVLLVKNAYDPEYLEVLNERYLEKYQDQFVDIPGDDPRYVGHKRNMITLTIEGEFNSEALYANEKILSLMRCLLGTDMIVNSIGSVVSMPGSQDQHIHRDMPNIYLTDINYGADDTWLSYTSPYAITAGVPLVPITKETGNTRFWPGTHIRKINHNDPALGPGEDFTSELGSCVLFDYRIIHAGVANTSSIPRPLLYCVYSRAWFRDSQNFCKSQKPLYLSREEYQKIPQQYRSMFDWYFR